MRVATVFLAGLSLVASVRAAEIVVTVEPLDAEVVLIPQKPDTTKLGKYSFQDGRHSWEVEGATGDMLSLYVKRPQYTTVLEFVPASGKELKISLKYSTQYADALQNSAFRERMEQESTRSREETRTKTRAALLAKYRDRGEKVAKAFRDNAPSQGMPVEMIIFIFGEPATRTKTSRVKGSDESLTYQKPEMTFYFTDDRLVRWSAAKPAQ